MEMKRCSVVILQRIVQASFDITLTQIDLVILRVNHQYSRTDIFILGNAPKRKIGQMIGQWNA
jgi:hypothetical protein